MRKMVLAFVVLCSPSIALAQATNPESSGAPASAQQGAMASGSARSMPQGTASMQNDTASGRAGLSTGSRTRHRSSRAHHMHATPTSNNSPS
jgi:hypothetical protein